MGIESFYKIKAADFNKIADKLESELNANNLIGDANFAFAFRAAISEAKDWYRAVKLSASQNNVDLGNRENFKEVLKAQIADALIAYKYEYADYLDAILNFLEMYYKWV